MSKPRILLQLDTDEQPSVFDSVVAIDAGADHLLRHHAITAENVRDRVHGAIFTRGPGDLHNTAIFIGGSNVTAAEAVLAEIRRTFFGPMRVSVMLDPSGANTTAAAAVAAAGEHVVLGGTTAVVLAATGPVGQRAVRLLAQEGATVRVVSRRLERAQAVCDEVGRRFPTATLIAARATAEEETIEALAGASIVIATGAAGIELASAAALARSVTLKVAIDLNAVPPAGLHGVEVMDRGVERNGVICYGAVGVGGVKMKVHKAALRRLFETNEQVLDAEEIYAIAKALQA